MPAHTHRPPRRCPVCDAGLLLTRLTCDECGTELAGTFEQCEFCGMSDDDRSLLRVFLASRGNLKEVQAHLGVSYPTARTRFDELLARLGMRPPSTTDAEADPELEVLEALQRGEISVDEADSRLG